MKLLSIFKIEAQDCLILYHLVSNVRNEAKLGKIMIFENRRLRGSKMELLVKNV